MFPTLIPRPALPALLFAALIPLDPTPAHADIPTGPADPAVTNAAAPVPSAPGYEAAPSSTRAAEDSAGIEGPRYGQPPARTIERLSQEHRRGDDLIVSTRERQLRLRVDQISPLGLEGIHARGGLPPFPVLEWKDVAKIERRRSGFRIGQVIGGFLGAPIPAGGATVIAGAWLGSRLGDSMARTTTLYEGVPLASEPEGGELAAALSGNAVNVDEAAVGRVVAAGDRLPDLDRIGRDVIPGRTVHVWGSFGEFTGTVDAIDHEGLHVLHVKSGALGAAQGWTLSRRPFDAAHDRLPDPIAWSQISGVYYLGNSGGRGAAYGGVLVGGGTGALAAAIAKSGLGLGGGGSTTDAIGAFFAGAAAGGLVGAGLGYLVGSAFKVWRPVPGLHASAAPEASMPEQALPSGVEDPVGESKGDNSLRAARGQNQ